MPDTLPMIDENPAPPTPTPKVVQVIEAPTGWLGLNWSELWRYRELTYFLAWRDVKVRYKQTFLGVLWALLQPVMPMLVFSLFFGKFAGLDQYSGGTPYYLYVFAGLLPWTFFANALNHSSGSLVSNTSLITKVYFPRLIIPIAAQGSALVDFFVAFALLIVMMACSGASISWQLGLMPLFLLGTMLLATGIGAALAALTVSYRDFQYVVPFSIQIWMFLTPVIYPSTIVPEKWRWLYAFNPMAGLLDGFRAAVLGHPFDWPQTGISLGVSVFAFLAGVAYFRNVEQKFADVI